MYRTRLSRIGGAFSQPMSTQDQLAGRDKRHGKIAAARGQARAARCRLFHGQSCNFLLTGEVQSTAGWGRLPVGRHLECERSRGWGSQSEPPRCGEPGSAKGLKTSTNRESYIATSALNVDRKLLRKCIWRHRDPALPLNRLYRPDACSITSRHSNISACRALTSIDKHVFRTDRRKERAVRRSPAEYLSCSGWDQPESSPALRGDPEAARQLY